MPDVADADATAAIREHNQLPKDDTIMITLCLRWRRPLALLVGPALLAVFGCSDSDYIGQLHKVSGTVKYKGEPVSKARINFVPTTKDGHGAQGQVENGSFTLTTLKPDDGVLAGDYKVTVDDRETDTAALKSQAEEVAKKKGVEKFSGGAMIPQELQAQALANAKGRIPGKYQLPDTTDLTAKVDANNRTFNFELKD